MFFMKLHFSHVYTLKLLLALEDLNPVVREINGKTCFDLRRRCRKLDEVKPSTNRDNTHTSVAQSDKDIDICYCCWGF